MGAFRFTDMDRNIVFASTDYPGLTKSPVAISRQRSAVQKPHYSKCDVGDVYGEQFVHVDKNVTNERVVIDVVYS